MSILAAELLKLRRSWSTWILIGLVPLFQLMIGYLLVYAVLQVPVGSEEEPGFGRDALLLTLRPEFFVSNVLSTLSGLGGAIALVLAAMSSAREYGWRTITTLLTLGPTRLGIFAAKGVSLAIVVLVMVLLTFGAGAVGAALVGGSEAGVSGYPPVTEVGAGVAAAWLILGTWAAIGHALGFLLRSTGLAIGIGLVYALVIENVIQGLGLVSDIFENVSRGMLGPNAAALAGSFGPEPVAEEFGLLVIDPPIASAILAAYLLVATAAAAFVFVRRDVT